MIVAWMVYTLLVSALIAVAARGVEELGRAARLPVRFVWVAALLATLGLAALAPFRAGLSEAAGWPAAVELSALPEGSLVAVERPGEGILEVVAAAVAAATAEARWALAWPVEAAAEHASGGVAVGLGVGWLALALGLLGIGTATTLRYRRARSGWPIREVEGTRVRVAPSAGPAVLGVMRPEIVVPGWLLERSASEQRLVVLHEREHLRAGDALTLTFGWVAAALVPWNPVTWWMLSRLRLAVELDCDARVLRQRVGRRAYGTMLIEIAGRGSGLSLGVPALAGSPSNLERRLLAMTTSFSRIASMRAAALGALGGVALLAACEARMPTSTEIDEMDAASAEAQAERFQLIADSGVAYFVDGEEVTAEEARAIAADRLAQVEVVRGKGQGGIIRLRTKAGAEIAADTMVLEGTDPETGERRRLVELRAAESGAHGEGQRIRIREAGLAVSDDAPLGGLDSFDGLMLIDGVDVGPELEGMKDLRPADIEKIEIIKGPAAKKFHDDPRAANGVILITTKKGAGSS